MSPQPSGLQIALSIIEERRFKAPESYANRYRLSDAQLDALIATLREHESCSNAPLMLVRTASTVFDNWLLGTYERCAFEGKPAESDTLWVTTDHVHCSELRGDAKDDGEAWVALRNNLPRILGALEELLMRRLGSRE
jgi:hypothetical protein